MIKKIDTEYGGKTLMMKAFRGDSYFLNIFTKKDEIKTGGLWIDDSKTHVVVKSLESLMLLDGANNRFKNNMVAFYLDDNDSVQVSKKVNNKWVLTDIENVLNTIKPLK